MGLRAALGQYLPASLLPVLQRVEASPLGIRLAKGAFWGLAGTVISRLLALGSWILIARLLGKTTFGELGMVQSTVGMFGTLAGLGLGLTATRYVAEYRLKDPQRAGRVIAFSTVSAAITAALASVILLVLAPRLAGSVLAAPHLTDLLRLGALIVLFSTLNGAQTGALSGFEAFRVIAGINLAAGLISFPLLLAGAWFGGLRGAVFGMAAGMFVNWLLNHLALRTELRKAGIPASYAGCWSERGVLWSFSIPVVLTGVLSAPVNWLCCALLANQPGGYAEIGVYNAAVQWQTALAFLPALLSQVLLPILSDSHSNDGAQQSRKTLSTALIVFLAVIILPAAGLIVLSPWIIALYGGNFGLSTRLFIAVVAYASLSNVGTALWTCLLARDRAWFGFAGAVAWSATIVVAFHYLLGWGAFGLAVASVIAYAVSMAVILPPVLQSLLARKTA